MSSNYINGDQLKEILTSGFSDVKNYIDNNSGGSGGAGLKIEDFNELVLNGNTTDVYFEESFDEIITGDVYNKLKNADILKFTDSYGWVYIGHKAWFNNLNNGEELVFIFTMAYGYQSLYTLDFYTIDITYENDEYHVYMPPTNRATLNVNDRKKIDNMPTHQYTVSFEYSANTHSTTTHSYCFSFSLLGTDLPYNSSDETPRDFNGLLNIINNLQKQNLPITYLASGMYDNYQISTCTITSITSFDITVALKYIGESHSFNTVTVTIPASAYRYVGSVKLMDC